MNEPLRSQRDPLLRARLTSVSPLPGVRAGSGLLAVGPRLLAVQDDRQAVVWIDPRTLQVETQVLDGEGLALPKRDKPDYEALLRAHDSSVWLIGSGALPNRRRWAQLRAGTASLRWQDASAVYELLEATLQGPPNIEGALLVEDRLRLWHRAAGDAPDACLDLSAAVLAGAAPRLLERCWLRLGAMDGVPLHLTDAALLADGRMAFLAAAENTADAIADGPVAGAALGVIGAEGARWTALLDPDGKPSRRKAEGLAPDADGRGGWLITDPDDAARPAELCRYELDGPW